MLIILTKLMTYNSQNYACILGSGLAKGVLEILKLGGWQE